VTTEVLSKRTLYAHGTLGMPLAVIGYPLAIWIPAHYSGGLGISLATVGTILHVGASDRCHHRPADGGVI
jgi:Na+/melibiose symporter-like transporter